jgi:hypothetical protein
MVKFIIDEINKLTIPQVEELAKEMQKNYMITPNPNMLAYLYSYLYELIK